MGTEPTEDKKASADSRGLVHLPQLKTGVQYKIDVRPPLKIVHLIEVADLNFHTDSAVFLPVPRKEAEGEAPPPPPPGEPEKPAGLSAVRVALRFAERFPEKKLLVAGHTDTAGSQAHNQTLSKKRSENVHAYLKGDADGWASSASGRHKTEDYQLILKWLARTRAWACDPGGIDGKTGPNTQKGLDGFRKAFNAEHKGSLATGGGIALADWKAFYTCYDQCLAQLAGCKPDELAAKRKALKYLDPAAIGCGESWPVDGVGVDGFKCETNRRVELLFFDQKEAPKLDCHAGGGCAKDKCKLYAEGYYKAEHVPVNVDDYAPADANVLLVELDDDLTPRLPEGLALRLEQGDREPVGVPWTAGKPVRGKRRFSFEGLPKSAECTLVAVANGEELVLFEKQVPDDPEKPVVWQHDIAELAAPVTEPAPPEQQGESPADLVKLTGTTDLEREPKA